MQFDTGIVPEIDIAGTLRGRSWCRGTGGPRDQSNLLGGARLRRHSMLAQTAEMRQPAAQEDVIPGRHMVHRHIDVGVLALQIDGPPVRAVLGWRR